jgi:hypothetical protein
MKNRKNTKTTTAPKKTLDIQHMSRLQEFNKISSSMETIESQINELDNKIMAIKNKIQIPEPDESDVSMMLNLRDMKQDLEKQLIALRDRDEVDYFIDTAPILFQYYDIVEKGSNDVPSSEVPDNSILKFFIKPPDQCTAAPTDEKSSDESVFVDRASLLDKYLMVTDDNYVKHVEKDTCDTCINCGSTNRNIMLNEGFLHCNDCDYIEYIIIDHDRPSYKDPPKEVSYFSYKRINHLNEWISQIQGKETTDIPEEIYAKILVELKKQRITNMADLTPKKVKEILKKLEGNRYYEHIPHIINRLTGMSIPHFEPELEEKLRVMFKMIQPLFVKYAPAIRKNFLSYSYCLHKFVQLLGRDEYLPNLPLLKNREKLQMQDMIWKKICEELNWQWIRSI